MSNTVSKPKNQNTVANAANAAANMSAFDAFFADVAAIEAKSPREIAEDVIANHMGYIVSTTIARVGTTGLFDKTIVDGEEVSVRKADKDAFLTLYLTNSVKAINKDGKGEMRNYVFISLYGLLGSLKQSPLAVFVDVLATQPELAATLLAGSPVDVFGEFVVAGTEHKSLFGKSDAVTIAKQTSIYNSILSIGVSPMAKAVLAQKAAMLAK